MKMNYTLLALVSFAATLLGDCQSDYEKCLRTKDPLTCDADFYVCEHPKEQESAAQPKSAA